MVEVLVAFGVVLLLLAYPAAGAFPFAGLLLAVGIGLLGVGLLTGVGAGVVYHVRLFRELARLGPVPQGWLWRPTSLHARLPRESWRGVKPWFYAGAAGFLVSVAGCALVLAAILTM